MIRAGVHDPCYALLFYEKMVIIKSVTPGSPAAKIGLQAEDCLLSIDGHDICDVLDYRFYMTARSVTLQIHRGPELFSVVLKKKEYEDAGLGFASYLMDKKRTCHNRCVFCFIDQNPPGMRETIYFKDDDRRLSFLQGNYITMTNLREEDLSRMIAMKTSPINISVHTTNPDLRVRMMHNKHAGEILPMMRRLADAGIAMNGQIVLCHGWNDGEELERSLRDLATLRPALQSVSIVPAGLTCHRAGLEPLTPFSPEEAARVIAQVDAAGARCLADSPETSEEEGNIFGGCATGNRSRLFFCSDEFYLRAGLPLPDPDYYEGYPQLENGVGMITSLVTEFKEEAEFLSEYHPVLPRKVTLATGAAAYETIRALTQKLTAYFPGLTVNVRKIVNRFYGESITVAGLLTGTDLLEQLRGLPLGDLLLLPRVTLRAEQDLFLDSMTPATLSEELGVPVRFCPNEGSELIRMILTDSQS